MVLFLIGMPVAIMLLPPAVSFWVSAALAALLVLILDDMDEVEELANGHPRILLTGCPGAGCTDGNGGARYL